MNISISINYDLKYDVVGYPNLAITSCSKIVNVRTGKVKKKCLNGGSVGYWIDSNTFKKLQDINKIAVKKQKLLF